MSQAGRGGRMQWLRIGLLAPPAAMLLLTTGLAARGDLPGASGFADAVHGDGFGVYTSASLNALVWLVFGAVAIHAALPERAGRARLFGPAFLIAGACVALPLVGVLRMAWTNAADPEALAEATTSSLTWRIWMPFQAASFLLAGLFTGVAFQKAGRPMWEAGLMGGGLALFATHLAFAVPWAVPAAGAAMVTAGSGSFCLGHWRRGAPQATTG